MRTQVRRDGRSRATMARVKTFARKIAKRKIFSDAVKQCRDDMNSTLMLFNVNSYVLCAFLPRMSS